MSFVRSMITSSFDASDFHLQGGARCPANCPIPCTGRFVKRICMGRTPSSVCSRMHLADVHSTGRQSRTSSNARLTFSVSTSHGNFVKFLRSIILTGNQHYRAYVALVYLTRKLVRVRPRRRLRGWRHLLRP